MSSDILRLLPSPDALKETKMPHTQFLITGATGATGGHAARQLLEKEHAVRVLAHRPDERSEQSLENTSGALHGAVAAAMLDTAMSAAAGTLLPADKRTITLDLTITYLEPLTIESGPIRAIGRVVDLAERTAYAAGEVRDGAGSLAAHAVVLEEPDQSYRCPPLFHL